MGKAIIIDEFEKLRILELYKINGSTNLLQEQKSSIIYASTTNEHMSNFGPNGNSKHGLKGNSSQENFYFKTNLLKLYYLSTGDSANFLSSFEPYTDAGQYIDYVRIGQNEITNSGKTTIDLSGVKYSETEVIATHNGLLVIKRLMDKWKGTKLGFVTLEFSAIYRESKRSDYNLVNLRKNFLSLMNGIESAISVLILNNRKSIIDSFAKGAYVNLTNEQIQTIVQNLLKEILVKMFLTDDEKQNIDRIITQKELTPTVDLTQIESFYGKGTDKGLPPGASDAWNTIQTNIRNLLIDNFKKYLDEPFKGLANDLKDIIPNNNRKLSDSYNFLFKTTTLSSADNNQSNKKKDERSTYDLGK